MEWYNIVAYVTLFITTGFVVVSLIRQMILNYRLRSVRGLSLSTVLTQLTSRLADLYFSVALTFPIVYPIIHIVLLCHQLVLASQYFLYSTEARTRLHIRALVIFVASLALWVWLYTAKHYYLVFGNIAGWGLVFSRVVTDTPQVLHNWRRGSVDGYSYSYAWMNLTAVILGQVSTICFGLPLQSHLQGWVAVVTKGIILVQYYYYGRGDYKKT